MPLDTGEPADPEARDDAELDWCFDDPELTRQLRAVKEGRGWLLMTAVSTLVALGAAIALVL